MSRPSLPVQYFTSAPVLSRRFPGVLFSHNDLEAYLRKASDSRSLDISGALLKSMADTSFISTFIATNQLSFDCMNFSCCQLTPEGLESLLARELRDVTTLVIRDNSLKKAAGYVIAKLFGSVGKIRVFDVQNNSLGDVGVSSIAGGLASELSDMKLRVPASPSPLTLSKLTLYELDLSGNDVGDLGVTELCTGLRALVSNAHRVGQTLCLKILRLSRNRITDKGARSLAQLVDLGHLAAYDRKDDSPGIYSVPRLEEYHMSLPLDELTLSDNLIGSEGVMAVLRAASGLESSSASDGETEGDSPWAPRGIVLKRLDFSRAELTMESVRVLSAYLASSRGAPPDSEDPLDDPAEGEEGEEGGEEESPIQVEFYFLEKHAINAVASTVFPALTNLIRNLATAVHGNQQIIKVALGALPEVMRRKRESLRQAKGDSSRPVSALRDPLLEDIEGALEQMHGIKETLDLPLEFREWVVEHIIKPKAEAALEAATRTADQDMAIMLPAAKPDLRAHLDAPANVSLLSSSEGDIKDGSPDVWDTTWDASFDYLSPKKMVMCLEAFQVEADRVLSSPRPSSIRIGSSDTLVLPDHSAENGIDNTIDNFSRLTSPLTPAPMHVSTAIGDLFSPHPSELYEPPFSPSNSSVFMTEIPDEMTVSVEPSRGAEDRAVETRRWARRREEGRLSGANDRLEPEERGRGREVNSDAGVRDRSLSQPSFRRERSRERVAQQLLSVGIPLSVNTAKLNTFERSKPIGDSDVQSEVGRRRVFDQLSFDKTNLLETLVGEISLLDRNGKENGWNAIDPGRVNNRAWLRGGDSGSSGTRMDTWEKNLTIPREQAGSGPASPASSSETDMQLLVQKAVDEALDKAQRQWLSALAPVLLSMRPTNGGYPSEPSRGQTEKTNTPPVGPRSADKAPFPLPSSPCHPYEMDGGFLTNERRLSIEGRMAIEGRIPNERRPSIEARLPVEELADRLLALESDIEFEHEASLQVLDALLCQHFKLSQQHKDKQASAAAVVQQKQRLTSNRRTGDQMFTQRDGLQLLTSSLSSRSGEGGHDLFFNGPKPEGGTRGSNGSRSGLASSNNSVSSRQSRRPGGEDERFSARGSPRPGSDRGTPLSRPSNASSMYIRPTRSSILKSTRQPLPNQRSRVQDMGHSGQSTPMSDRGHPNKGRTPQVFDNRMLGSPFDYGDYVIDRPFPDNTSDDRRQSRLRSMH